MLYLCYDDGEAVGAADGAALGGSVGRTVSLKLSWCTSGEAGAIGSLGRGVGFASSVAAGAAAAHSVSSTCIGSRSAPTSLSRRRVAMLLPPPSQDSSAIVGPLGSTRTAAVDVPASRLVPQPEHRHRRFHSRDFTHEPARLAFGTHGWQWRMTR